MKKFMILSLAALLVFVLFGGSMFFRDMSRAIEREKNELIEKGEKSSSEIIIKLDNKIIDSRRYSDALEKCGFIAFALILLLCPFLFLIGLYRNKPRK